MLRELLNDLAEGWNNLTLKQQRAILKIATFTKEEKSERVLPGQISMMDFEELTNRNTLGGN